MNKLYSTGISAIISFVLVYGLMDRNDNAKKQPYVLGDAMSNGSGEGEWNERYHYEWQRLHDPATGKIPMHVRQEELAFAAHVPSDAMLSAKRASTVATWNERGPWNVGGRTRAMAIDVTNEAVVLAGTCSGGMWRSADTGQTWVETFQPSQLQSVSCLVQDKRAGHTSTWYAGSGEAYGASASDNGAFFLGDGLYKSTDNGVTWSAVASTSTNSPHVFDQDFDLVWNVKINNADTSEDVIYAATYGALWKSVDGGLSWAGMLGFNSSQPSSYFTDVEVTPTGIVYATLSSDGYQKGIYRSPDGNVYTNILPPNFPVEYNRLVIGYAPADENQVYFLGNTPNAGQPDTNYQGDVDYNSLWKYTYLSGNGAGSGGVWEDLSANLPVNSGFFDRFDSQGSYNLVVQVKPDDTSTVFIGGTNIFRSTSAFKDDAHTTKIGGYQLNAVLPVVNSYPNHHPDQHVMCFFPSDPGKMISANDGGVFLCNNNTDSSVTWTSLNNGYLTTMFYTVALDHAVPGNNIVIAGAQDNGTWFTNNTNLTAPWVQPRGGDGSYCFIADNQSAYYFSIQNGKMMRAKCDAAGHVDSFARIDPIGLAGYQFINPFVLDPNNNNNILYLAGGRVLWRNDDLNGIPYAQNWDSISTNWTMFPDSVLSNESISCVSVSTNPPNRVYYGTTNRKVYRLDSANTGIPTRVDITSYTGTNAFPAYNGNIGYPNVGCIAVDPANADNLLVVFTNYRAYSLYYSSDGGTSWTKSGGNLEYNTSGNGPGASIRWAAFLHVTGGTVYLLGTSTGLYATTQLNGVNTGWVQQGANTIGNAVVDMIDCRQSDGTVVVATHAHGIYSATITSITDIAVAVDFKEVNTNFDLKCFPNPFSKQTVAEFNLPQRSEAKITLLDMHGRIVDVPVDGVMNEGMNRVTISRKNLSAGIYFCTLKAGEHSITRKLLIAD